VQETHCPECHTELEIRDVTPCHDCGWAPDELDHYREHTYAEVRAFGVDGLVLCNFCEVDFTSYEPSFFGLPRGTTMKLPEQLRALTTIGIGKDKFCPRCRHRLAFLRFVGRVRAGT
jgi:hypothetical protein